MWTKKEPRSSKMLVWFSPGQKQDPPMHSQGLRLTSDSWPDRWAMWSPLLSPHHCRWPSAWTAVPAAAMRRLRTSRCPHECSAVAPARQQQTGDHAWMQASPHELSRTLLPMPLCLALGLLHRGAGSAAMLPRTSKRRRPGLNRYHKKICSWRIMALHLQNSFV